MTNQRKCPTRGPIDAAGAKASENAGAEVPESVLDQGALGKIRMVGRKSGRDVLSKVVSLYLELTPDALNSLAAAIERADAAAVAQLAHQLKSSSGNLGAQRLVERFRRLEHAAKAGDLEPASALFAEIMSEFESAKRALEAELPEATTLSESA